MDMYSKGLRKSQSQVDKVATENHYITEEASQGIDGKEVKGYLFMFSKPRMKRPEVCHAVCTAGYVGTHGRPC